MPKRIFEIRPIKWLLEHGTIVICAGGGGIPTMYEPGTHRKLIGIEAVIDKDLASELLARELDADLFVMVTDAEAVFLDWGKPTQKAIRRALTGRASRDDVRRRLDGAEGRGGVPLRRGDRQDARRLARWRICSDPRRRGRHDHPSRQRTDCLRQLMATRSPTTAGAEPRPCGLHRHRRRQHGGLRFLSVAGGGCPYGALAILAWIVMGVGAICLGLAFARLARMAPATGGPYAYTRMALRRLRRVPRSRGATGSRSGRRCR